MRNEMSPKSNTTEENATHLVEQSGVGPGFRAVDVVLAREIT